MTNCYRRSKSDGVLYGNEITYLGGSRDSGTGCALVGVSRYNFTNVYFCIMFYIYIE